MKTKLVLIVCIVYFSGLMFALSAELDLLMINGIQNNVFTGGVALVSYKKQNIYHKAWGSYTYDVHSPIIKIDTLFDIASLTKVVATTTAAMILYDCGLIDLEDKVIRHLPEFGCHGKEEICIKHLLTHTSGIDDYKTTDSNIFDIMHAKLINSVGAKFVYSCLNMIILQKILESITGIPLDQFVETEIFRPLGMHNTTFKPEFPDACVPTDKKLQGIVHDDLARKLGGVSGNAGLFSTTQDLAIFMQMILNNGSYISIDGDMKQLIQPETVMTWTKNQCPFNRGYGWMVGKYLADYAFGHTGWTGVSVWADRERQLCCILLTNSVYLSQNDLKITEFREKFHDKVLYCLNEFEND